MPNFKAPMQLLGGISAEKFLAEYWQKKPLLIRQAIPDFSSPVLPDDLAGLSMEEIVESRIILEEGENHPWELRRGPFTERDFETLPDTHWTLLIQQLDAWVPEINDLKKHFQFVPNWRIDDIMASYAPLGGSVGPHFDYYDVFLLQAHGERHWRIGQVCDETSPTLCSTSLSILEEFKEQDAWILQPGDMLYLPPKLAHFGVAQNDCITLSVGFRAPTETQMLSSFTDHLIQSMPDNAFYEDPDLKLQDHCGEISNTVLEKVAKVIEKQLKDPQQLKTWFGEFLTEPKNEQAVSDSECTYEEQDILDAISEDELFIPNEGSRFAFSEDATNTLLFADGKRFQLLKSNLKFVQTLCEMGPIPAKSLTQDRLNPQIIQLLVDLLNQGSIYLDHE